MDRLIRPVTFGDAVTLYPDGRVVINPRYEVDAAARAFWDAVKTLSPFLVVSPLPCCYISPDKLIRISHVRKIFTVSMDDKQLHCECDR